MGLRNFLRLPHVSFERENIRQHDVKQTGRRSHPRCCISQTWNITGPKSPAEALEFMRVLLSETAIDNSLSPVHVHQHISSITYLEITSPVNVKWQNEEGHRQWHVASQSKMIDRGTYTNVYWYYCTQQCHFYLYVYDIYYRWSIQIKLVHSRCKRDHGTKMTTKNKFSIL